MKKVKNDSQPFISYIIPIFVLPILASFVGLYFYAILSSFDKINFGSIYGILLSVIFFYVIVRGLKNGILYFIPREECYIEDDNLIYRRIFLFKFIFKKLRIPLLDIQDIIDKGSKIPKAYANSSNPLNYITIFFKPYGKWFANELKKNVDWFFHQTPRSEQLAKNIGLVQSSISGDTRFDRVKQIQNRDNFVEFIQGDVATCINILKIAKNAAKIKGKALGEAESILQANSPSK